MWSFLHLWRLLPGGVDFDETQVNGFFANTTIEVDDVVWDHNGDTKAQQMHIADVDCVHSTLEL